MDRIKVLVEFLGHYYYAVFYLPEKDMQVKAINDQLDARIGKGKWFLWDHI